MKRNCLLTFFVIFFATKLFALNMISIKGGWFTMGDDKTPLSIKHNVYVSSFELSPYEVTYEQFCNFIKDRYEILDTYDKGLIDDSVCADELGYYPPMFHYNKQWPMIRISFYTALLFCNWLSEIEGLTPCYEINDWNKEITVKWNKKADGYRLPTEAEWEYSAGCGGTDLQMYDYSKDNLNKIANYWNKPNNDVLIPVASKKPNKWGLYDMLGNVWEWCWDLYNYYPENNINPVREDIALKDESYLESSAYNGEQDRVRRGGCKASMTDEVSVTYRSHRSPWTRTYYFTGLRVARNAPDIKIFTYYVNDTRVRLRKEANLKCETLRFLENKEAVEVIEETEFKECIGDKEYPWIRIRTMNNEIGYVYGE